MRAVRESLRKQGEPFLSSLRVTPTFSRLGQIALQTLSIHSLNIFNDFPKQPMCSCGNQCVPSACLYTISAPSAFCQYNASKLLTCSCCHYVFSRQGPELSFNSAYISWTETVLIIKPSTLTFDLQTAFRSYDYAHSSDITVKH